MNEYDMVQEASTLRGMLMQAGRDAFAPGHWPKVLELDGVTLTAVAQKRDTRENELIGVVYENRDFRMLVLND